MMTVTTNTARYTMYARAVDDTTGCPLAPACEACARRGGARGVYTADTPPGPVCLTLCPICAEEETVPRWSLDTCARRVAAHCDHTGRDLDGHPIGSEPLDEDGRAWRPCLTCGRVFPDRDDRPYCPSCEDGSNDDGEGWS